MLNLEKLKGQANAELQADVNEVRTIIERYIVDAMKKGKNKVRAFIPAKFMYDNFVRILKSETEASGVGFKPDPTEWTNHKPSFGVILSWENVEEKLSENQGSDTDNIPS